MNQTVLLTADAQVPGVECQLARRTTRLVGFLIDVAIFAIASAVKVPLRIAGFDALGSVVSGLLTAALGGVSIWLLAVRGQTLGKVFLKIAIVDKDSKLPPGFLRTSVIRQGPQSVLSLRYPLLGFVYTVIDGLFIWSKTRRCIHDRLAGRLWSS
jgi:uncharacterized RDD family membrane protein YckC